MLTTGRAPSRRTAPDELTASHSPFAETDGLGPERVVEIQRARLLMAMTELACELGAGNVTVAHVVARAGVSRRTFYEIFEDREACFLAALDNALARASRCVLDAYDPHAKWAERVRTALTALLSFVDVERSAGWLLIVGSLGAGPKALERRKRVLAEMITVIDEGRGESRPGSVTRGRAGLPPLTAEGVLGGVLSVLHARLLDAPSLPVMQDLGRGSPSALESDALVELTGSLMSMIVLPYLGARAAQQELERPVPETQDRHWHAPADPLRGLGMRLTYRTVCVLLAVAAHPGGSNREIGHASGVADQGQISKLLSRLERLGLVCNAGLAPGRGAPNAWTLTAKGLEVEGAMSADMTGWVRDTGSGSVS